MHCRLLAECPSTHSLQLDLIGSTGHVWAAGAACQHQQLRSHWLHNPFGAEGAVSGLRSRAGITSSSFVSIAYSNKEQRFSAVGPINQTIKTGSGKTPAVQFSTKLVCGSIELVSSGDSQHSSRSSEQARESQVSVSNAHCLTQLPVPTLPVQTLQVSIPPHH
jgi:hypothetical protein